jgi:UDP-3-O-[3-hydroxymyristoyl] glucosamine N-acyltransferase
MKLSSILKEMNVLSHEITEDIEFETLALSESSLENNFCTFLDNPKFIDNLSDNASIIITNKEISSHISNRALCIVEEPRMLFFRIHNFLKDNLEYVRSNFKSIIKDNCKISNLSSIASENVIIGNNVVIEEFVVIRENTVIDDNCIIRAGSIIGGEGFEFKRDKKNYSILEVKHLGGVVIEKNVEIQQNVCIDKAVYPWDNTIIGENSKLDNFIHVAHAVKIGKNVLIAAQTGFGGRTIIKNDSWIGFATTITNGIEIGENANVNIGAVVTKKVNAGESVSGNFAIDHKKFIEFIKSIR